MAGPSSADELPQLVTLTSESATVLFAWVLAIAIACEKLRISRLLIVTFALIWKAGCPPASRPWMMVLPQIPTGQPVAPRSVP